MVDGGDSVRTNPVHLWPDLGASYCRVTIDTGTYGAPTGPLPLKAEVIGKE